MDPFDILGLARDASEEDIRKAFKRLAHEYHPDRNPGDAEAPVRFRRIKAAYDTIRAVQRREAARAHAQAPGHARPTRRTSDVPRASEPREEREPFGWSTDDPTKLDDVVARLRELVAALDRVREARAVTVHALDAVIDAARWTRLHVDLALAFKQQVDQLRDGAWRDARYAGAEAALELFAAFRDSAARALASKLGITALRNLRARLDGLMAVAKGYRDALAPSS